MYTTTTKICIDLAFYLLIFGTTTPSTAAYSNDSSIWAQRQIQISNLFNFFCLRNADQLQAIQSPFDPLNHLFLYSNPSTVEFFTTALHSGKLFPRSQPFVKGGQARDEMVLLIEILYFIDIGTPTGWDLFYNTTAFYSLRVNVGQFYWAMGTIFSTKLFGLLSPPPLIEMVPQLYTPKDEVRRINGFPSPPPPPGGHILARDEPLYWMTDPLLSEFHLWWHTDVENVLDNKKLGLLYDRKGEIFFYVHHQIISRYIAERRSSGLGDIVPLSLLPDFRIEKGYEAYHLDVNLAEYPMRGQNTSMWTQGGFADLILSEKRVLEAVDSGYATHALGHRIPLRRNPETFDSEIIGSDILGALVESSTLSVNLMYYKAMHGSLHGNLANLKDSRYPQQVISIGVQNHEEVNMVDPVFYQIHLHIDNIFKRHKYLSPQIRTEAELLYPGVDLYSVRIDPADGSVGTNNNGQKPSSPQILTTFFEEYSFDISNSIVDCRKLERGETFRTKRQRLNYHQFLYNLEIFSHRSQFPSENAIVRIFMAPSLGADGHPSPPDDLHWHMILMDRFPIVLRPGWNRIKRSSQDSVVTVKEGVRACGYPSNLLLPKGTKEGLPMKMFVMLTPAGNRLGVTYTVDNEKFFPAHAVCGHPYLPFPDDRPMGYPFDKKIQFNPSDGHVRKNYGFYDIVIKHLSQSS